MVSKETKRRNNGIELLRIISAFSIILLHIMGHGGIRDSLRPGDINYYVLWFIMLASFCGVNCFALISGYVGYHDTDQLHRSSRFIGLWFQVVFYCVTTVAVFGTLKISDISVRDFVEALFPITFEEYWYFSAYFGVFVFMPLINKFVREFSNTYLIEAVIVGAGALSVLATIMTRYSDPFSLKGGYGAVWLIFLYFIGAVIKKIELQKMVKDSSLVFVFSTCLIFTWLWKVVLISVIGHGIDDMLVIYISPTIFLMSVCLLILFSKFEFTGLAAKLISFIAPTAFGIYLFQDSNYFREYIVAGRYVPYAFKNPLIMVGLILLAGLIQFIIGLLIDKCRIVLFNMLGIKKLSNRIGTLVDSIIVSIITRLEKLINART